MNQVIKVAISFLSTESNANLTSTVDGICVAMTDNPNYNSVVARIPEILLENESYQAKIAAAADGGSSLTAAMRSQRDVVVASMRNLALYVQMNCLNDLAILLSSGFKAQKTTRTPAVIPATPSVRKLSYGTNTGTVAMKLVAGDALSYNWRCYLSSAPDLMLQPMQTSAANTLFTGLTPGETYFFQGNIMNSAGTSDWSAPMSLLVV